MSLVVREMQSHALAISLRLRYPKNAVPDKGIDLKRKVIPICSQAIPITTLDIFGPKLPSEDDLAFGPVVLTAVLDPVPARIEEIQRAVIKKYGLTRLELTSSRRTFAIVRPRQIAMYLCKLLTPRSLPEIGRRFGGKDHTTVLHAVRKIEARRNIDKSLDAELTELIETIAAV